MNSDLDIFVDNISKNPKLKIAAILLYGSLSMGNKNPSDFDVMVLTDTHSFQTQLDLYQIVAKSTAGLIKPTIKSLSEINANNKVTMTRRYVQHLRNISKVLYSSPECHVDFGEMYNSINLNQTTNVAYMTSPALIIRHRLFELCKGVFTKVMADDLQRFDRPSKYLYQSSVDALGLELSNKEESRVLEKFYEIIGSGTPEDIPLIYHRIADINKELDDGKTKEELKEKVISTYSDFKDIIERDLWALNEYLTALDSNP